MGYHSTMKSDTVSNSPIGQKFCLHESASWHGKDTLELAKVGKFKSQESQPEHLWVRESWNGSTWEVGPRCIALEIINDGETTNSETEEVEAWYHKWFCSDCELEVSANEPYRIRYKSNWFSPPIQSGDRGQPATTDPKFSQ